MTVSRDPSPGRSEPAKSKQAESIDRVHSSTSLKDAGTLSDTENGERPVREQLKNTTIDGATLLEGQAMATNKPSQRKRVHDDDEDDEDTTSQPERHVRKRSKDLSGSPRATAIGEDQPAAYTTEKNGMDSVNPDQSAPNHSQTSDMDTAGPSTPPSEQTTEEKGSALTSPKNKRPHGDAFVPGAETEKTGQNGLAPATKDLSTTASTGNAGSKPIENEPRTKRQKDVAGRPNNDELISTADQGPQQATAKPAGGFSNSSTAAPFGALAGSKASEQEQPQTSASAFAASGFSALSKSSSPFASLGSNAAPSPFANAGATKSPPPASAFGASLGDSNSKSPFASVSTGAPSPFGGAKSSTSGFGGLSSGFGGSLGGSAFGGIGGGKLSSFAGGSGPAITGLSDKPAKPFGAQAGEEEDDEHDEEGETGDDDGEGAKSPGYRDEDKKDGRFYEQKHETGEEDESTIFSSRSKLYNFVKLDDGKKEWKERGLGTVKLNVKETDDGKTARFIMRAEGSHRVILNTPIKKEINVGDPQGGRPKGQYVYFSGTIDNKPQLELLQLKMRQQFAEELYDKIEELKKEM